MKKPVPNNIKQEKKPVLKPLTTYMIPLTSNHLVVSFLTSMEAILIPAALRKYGRPGSSFTSHYFRNQLRRISAFIRGCGNSRYTSDFKQICVEILRRKAKRKMDNRCKRTFF